MPVSATVIPVTQAALVEVNKASINGVETRVTVEIGSMRSTVPTRTTAKKPRTMIWVALKRKSDFFIGFKMAKTFLLRIES